METLVFAYNGDFGDEVTTVTKEISDEMMTLTQIADAFADFIRATGYDYVTGVTFHKENGGDVRGNGLR